MKYKRRPLIGIILVTILAGTSVFLFMQNKLLKQRTKSLQTQIIKQDELIDSVMHSGLAIELNSVLEKIDEELKSNPKRSLSDETIARITALSYSCKPYLRPEGDSIAGKKLSPERGLLLLMLYSMNIDSASFQKITLNTSFSGADLKDANLKGVDLRWVDLSGADLQNANLQESILIETNLKLANLWGANLKKANLSGANLTRADLRWADLNEADLKRADLFGADLSSAQLKKADLREAVLHWSELNHAFLNEANLTGTNLFRANMKRANLEKSILYKTNLTWANLTEANLTKTNLTGGNLFATELKGIVISDKNWLNLLNTWNVKGAKEIQNKYKLVLVGSDYPYKYRLEKIEE